jgi:hypothetical protein
MTKYLYQFNAGPKNDAMLVRVVTIEYRFGGSMHAFVFDLP